MKIIVKTMIAKLRNKSTLKKTNFKKKCHIMLSMQTYLICWVFFFGINFRTHYKIVLIMELLLV